MAVPILWSDEMVTILKQMREDGHDTQAIGDALGVSRFAVCNQLIKMGRPVGRRFAAEKASARHAFMDRMCRVDLRRGRNRYA